MPFSFKAPVFAASGRPHTVASAVVHSVKAHTVTDLPELALHESAEHPRKRRISHTAVVLHLFRVFISGGTQEMLSRGGPSNENPAPLRAVGER